MQRHQRDKDDHPEGPWNPGIQSGLTRELLELSTIFRSENSFSDITQATELRDVTGLPIEDLAIFRPERLALHEVLVRVTADYEIPDPEDASVSSLGMNLRRMAQTLMSLVVDPNRSEINDLYQQARSDLDNFIRSELAGSFRRTRAGPFSKQAEAPRGLWAWFRKQPTVAAAPVVESEWDRDERVILEWSMRAHTSETALEKAAFRSLVRVASAIRLKHDRILGNTHSSRLSLWTSPATTMAAGLSVDSSR
ncbi:hypothetical protein [Skermanella pratensis]|uniref:hypothetical protein n=1 Tax=Skermanella pratensis TaxID=2233999 RepID=UPI001301670F|nr:hypothetical protein [Skermanella pratensis]